MAIPTTVNSLLRSTAALAAVAVLAAGAAAQTGTADEKPATQPEAKTVFALLDTSMGDIVLALDAAKAPVSVENFLGYAEKEFYDGTIFHRVISNFMIQGGGFDQNMQKKATEAPIVNEWRNGLKNKRGTIAMARLGGQPDSATSQFFINVKDNDFLDQPRDGAGYAVFGNVVVGLDVVDRIRAVPTGRKGPYGDVPVTPVVIEKVRRITDAEAERRMKGVTTKPQQ